VNAEKVKDISAQASIEQRQINELTIAQSLEQKKPSHTQSV
jgi:hypothetical protein